MSGNEKKNSALPFSSLSLAPLGSASGRSGRDSVLPLAGRSLILQQDAPLAVPKMDSGWQSSKCSCGKKKSRQSWPHCFVFEIFSCLNMHSPSVVPSVLHMAMELFTLLKN